MKSFSHFLNKKYWRKKYWRILDINVWNFNETLTNDIVSFEQPVPWSPFQVFQMTLFYKDQDNNRKFWLDLYDSLANEDEAW